MTLAFASPHFLWLLPLALLPLLARRRSAVPISSLGPVQQLKPSWRIRLHRQQPACATLGLALLLLLLAGPVQRHTTHTTVREGVDLMLALDVSASLGAADIAPSRMVAARTAAADFLEARRDDRVGVILFSGVPVLLSAPVLDKGPLIARLRTVEADRSGSGTAIGDALAAALARLKESPASGKAVVLLTDGSSNRGRVTPRAATRAAAALGIRVYTIGIGSMAGAEVPLGPDGAPARLPDGSLLRVSLEEEPLEEMARLTGGQYFRATDGDTLRAVYRRIDALERSPLETRTTIDDLPLTPWLQPLMISLVALELLLFRLWLRCRPTGYVSDMIAAGALLLLCLPVPRDAGRAASPATGPALALAVDVSTSMAAPDVVPDRLAKTRQNLRTLVTGLPNARFSLVLFGGEGMIQSPLTEDREALLFFIDRLTPGMLASPGSAPEEGVLTALQTLPPDAAKDRGVVLFSDGERTVSGVPPRLPTATPVYVVPVGTTAGGPVSDSQGIPRNGQDGQPIVTRLDQERLQLIAATTGGTVLQGDDNQPATLALVERWRPSELPRGPQLWWLWSAFALLALRQIPWPQRAGTWPLPLTAAVLLLGGMAACSGSSSGGEQAYGEGLKAAKNGAFTEAAEAFGRAAETLGGSQRGAALYNQGTMLLAAGNNEHAATTLEQALLLLPGDTAARTNLALALRALGDRPPSGSGDGEQNNEGSGDGEMSREQALQLVEAIKPQAFAAVVGTDQVRERAIERDW